MNKKYDLLITVRICLTLFVICGILGLICYFTDYHSAGVFFIIIAIIFFFAYGVKKASLSEMELEEQKQEEQEEIQRKVKEQEEIEKIQSKIEEQKQKKKQQEEREQNKWEKARKAREERINKIKDEFNNQLAEIPKAEIKLSSDKINNNLVMDMPEIRFTKPRKNNSLYNFADFVVIDIETTGLRIQNEIVEVSAIRYVDFEPTEAFTTLIKPKKEIPANVSEINHITNEMVEDKPTIKQIIPALSEFIGKSTLLGHNLMFDLRFLYKYGYDFTSQKRKYIDTLDIAKSKLKKYDEYKEERAEENNRDYDWDVDDYKLDTLCEYYNIYRNNAHRSLSDCYATAQLFIKLLDEYELGE